MRTIEREIVSAMIFSSDNKLLLGKKDASKGGVYSDVWHIPGGGIDAGESLLDGLKREMKEEVGIDISPYEVILVDDADWGETEKTLETGERVLCKMHFTVYTVILETSAEETRVVLSDDLAECRWVALDELASYALTPPSVKLFKKLGYLTT